MLPRILGILANNRWALEGIVRDENFGFRQF